MAEIVVQRPPEVLQNTGNMVGLHTRLVLADQTYLQYNKPCPKEELGNTASFEQRNYKPFENASRSDRRKYWQERETQGAKQTFQDKYEIWSKALVETFNMGDKKSLKALSPLLQRAGVSIEDTDTTFTLEHAVQLYNRYFAQGGSEAGVKQFVADVLATHQTNGSVNAEQLAQDVANIDWLANIFGHRSKEMVTHLILAETNLKATPDFVQKAAQTQKDPVTNKEAMRINNLNDDEKRILDHIAKFAKQKEEGSEQPPTMGELPILVKKEEIQEKVKNNDSVVIVGGTGSGKTLKTPQFIMEIMGPNDKLIVTEPRQINTKELATSVAREAGVKLGEKIGFAHGGETDYSADTDVLFLTEGTLLSMLLKDRKLKEYTHVMVDEVHVRSSDTEQVLAYLKKAQELRRAEGLAPLKIIAASATVDKEQLQKYLNNAPLVEVPGRQHNIDYNFETTPLSYRNKPQRAAEIVKENIASGKTGSTVIAVAGIREMGSYDAALQTLGPDVEIVRIHAGSSEEDKQHVSKVATSGKHRVIIATDAIQTGITIPDLKFLINTGEVFERTVDPETGLEYIRLIPQSKAAIEQWSGRVGRTSAGKVYNLFTKEDYESRQDYPTPEMKRKDLTDVVLRMKRSKIQNIHDIDLLSEPIDNRRVTFAEQALRKLGALNADGTLSEIGERMDVLPLDFHLARMIVEAERKGRGVKEVCIVAAMSEARSLFEGDRRKQTETALRFRNPHSDFLTYLRIWREFEASGSSRDWAQENGLNFQSLMKIKQAIDKYTGRANTEGSQPATDEEVEQCVVAGLKHKVMRYNDATRSYVWERPNVVNINMRIKNDSALAGASSPHAYIVTADNGPVENNAVEISKCQRVKPEWL